MLECMNFDTNLKFNIDLPNYGIEDGYVLRHRQFWYKDGDKDYFVKIDSYYNKFECYSERSAFYLALLFGLDCVQYEVIPVIVNGELKSASRCRSYLNRFEHNECLFEINYGSDMSTDDIMNLTSESLDKLCLNISNKTGIPKTEIYRYFMRIALFDYLILNTDRHLANISFIKGLNYYRLAPIYDNGAAFFNEFNGDDIRDGIKFKTSSSKSIFKDLSIFGDTSIKELASEWLGKTDNLKSLVGLINKEHLDIVKIRFEDLLKIGIGDIKQ